MEDFKNSVAHLDVDVSTDISYEAVVGENFYKFLYVSQKTGLTPTLLTKDTYVDVLKSLITDDNTNLALATKNLASLFTYGTNVRGIILSAQDYEKYKYKGYFVYLESDFISRMVDEYNPVTPNPTDNPNELGWYELDGETYVLSEDTVVDPNKIYYVKTQVFGGIELSPACKVLFDYIDTVLDSRYSQVLTDVAIPYTATTKVQAVADFMSELNKYTMKISVFPRGANEDYSWDKEGDGNVRVGLSPSLYQLGRTLGFTNTQTGTPVGNSCDSVACEQADVLVTRSTSTEEIENPSAQLIDWMQNARLQYFKTVGNGTGNLSCYGGWTIKGSVVCADWIVAYCNYMTKVACAGIVTAMNTFKDEISYDKCVNAMDEIVSTFASMGRITQYAVTAPAFGSVQSNGHTIVIPDAWKGIYVDNLRNVKIQGALTIEE